MGVHVCMGVCVVYDLIFILEAPLGYSVGLGVGMGEREVREPGRDGGQLDRDGRGNAWAFECIEDVHRQDVILDLEMEVMERLGVTLEVLTCKAGWTVEPFTEVGNTGTEPGRQRRWGGGRAWKALSSSSQHSLGLCTCSSPPHMEDLLLNFVPLSPLQISFQTSHSASLHCHVFIPLGELNSVSERNGIFSRPGLSQVPSPFGKK